MWKFTFALIVSLFIGLPASIGQEFNRDQALLGMHYVPSNHDILSHLVWRYKYFPVDDDEAIDEFIAITNCQLYSDYYDNDFLWQRIREGYRRDLRYYAGTYPERYEFVSAIQLGKYDFRQSAFELDERSKLSNAGMLTIATNDSSIFSCQGKRYLDKYPYAYTMVAENPFSVDFIPVAPSEAKELVQRLESYRYKNKNNKRLVIMRIRAKLSSLERFEGNGVYSRGVFKGQLDEVAIFESPKMEKLIWKKTFKDLE